jgi:hypothetical protein
MAPNIRKPGFISARGILTGALVGCLLRPFAIYIALFMSKDVPDGLRNEILMVSAYIGAAVGALAGLLGRTFLGVLVGALVGGTVFYFSRIALAFAFCLLDPQHAHLEFEGGAYYLAWALVTIAGALAGLAAGVADMTRVKKERFQEELDDLDDDY